MKLVSILGWTVGGFALLTFGTIGYFAATEDEYIEERKAQDKANEQKRRVAVRDTVHEAGLAALIRQENRAEDFIQVASDIRLLTARYPESPQSRALGPLQGTYDSLARLAQQREAVKEQRRHQPKYYIYYPRHSDEYWTFRHYTDEFNDNTPAVYLTNRYRFRGTTTSYGYTSPVVADMLVDSANAIRLAFFSETRYPGTRGRSALSSTSARTVSQAITSPEPTDYTVLVRDDEGRTYKLAARAILDQFKFTQAASQTLHNVLKNGSRVRLILTRTDNPTLAYSLTIDNADDYEAFYHELMTKNSQREPMPAAASSN